MRKFDTKVQQLKYEVLREVARQAFRGSLARAVPDIPQKLAPGPAPTMRCCVYKERAILMERVKLAMGGNPDNPNVIEVIGIACDECPVGGYEVTRACRGCIAHRCEGVCPRGAIRFDHRQKAQIDKSKCVECGRCARVCPYGAIVDNKRPCENACRVKAIRMDAAKTAQIDNDACIACGACVYQCPFGAVMDKSFLLDVIRLIQESDENRAYRLYAVAAPSIASQFTYARLGQVVSGIRRLGFHNVVEAALGADAVACRESGELAEKGFLLSSCCPAFVRYVQTQFPALAGHISENPSPMAVTAAMIKRTDPEARVVFIGPCTAKKQEYRLPAVRPFVDAVLTFEELQALLDGRDIDVTALEETPLDNASCFGRLFARSGGLSDALRQALRERGLEGFAYSPAACDGVEACRAALVKASRGCPDANFIEGMACPGGCIGGAGCLTHGEKDRREVDRYGMEAHEKKITDALRVLDSVGARGILSP